MAEHTTNYVDTFIAVSPDSGALVGAAPPERATPTVARLQFEMLEGEPYRHTSDDVIYASQGARRGIGREEFFSKGQPCLRTSPLVKTYGWGVHSDDQGRVAIYPVESSEYRDLAGRSDLEQRAGMRSSRH